MRNIAHFTHNDLDALGCMLSIETRYIESTITTFHTNYTNIYEKVHDLIDWCLKEEPSLIFITDVSFALEKNLLLEITKKLPVNKIVYLDHHIYPEDFWNDFKNIPRTIDTTRSASKITFDLLHRELAEFKMQWLEKIILKINAYDLWKTEESSFNDGFLLNEYFWQYKDIDGLCEYMIKNKKPSNDYESTIKSIKENSKNTLKSYRDRNLIYSDGETTIAFIDEYFNYLLLEEFKKGIKFLVVANSYGVVRIRTNKEADISGEQKDKIKLALVGSIETGHKDAYAYKIKNSSHSAIMNEVQKVIKTIKETNGTN